MKNKSIGVIAMLLIFAIGNYFRMMEASHVRTVEFLSILVIGVLIGALVCQLFQLRRVRKSI